MATSPSSNPHSFRLNVLTNDALMSPREGPRPVLPFREPQTLPDPAFPTVPADQCSPRSSTTG